MGKKKVISLVKLLGARSFEQVKDWLRQIGYQVDSPNFGPLTEVDDEIVERLRELAQSAKSKKATPGIKKIIHAAKEEAPTKSIPRPKEVLPPSVGTEPSLESGVSLEVAPIQRPKLKSIVEERKPPKVKLEKAKKKREPAPQPAKEEEALVEVIEEEKEEKPPLKKAGKAKEPVPTKIEEPARPKPLFRERRASRGLDEILLEDEGIVVSRKRVFKVKGVKRKEPEQEVVRHVKISRPMSIREVSAVTGVKVAQIIQFLFDELDVAANINYVASIDEITLICDKFNIPCDVVPEEPEKELDVFEKSQALNPVPRPPVVTVMGHVDHGKTKLLDTIRSTNVVDKEAGGITQHIGAYQVFIGGKKITFIDTPGHEAFTAMRARGSQVTDIVVLVVAADDGVMPQTIEALEHAKAAKVPVIVAVNKIDKPEANPDKVRHELSKYGLVPEQWGGDTIYVNVSALTGQGVSELLEMIQLQAELMDLKADPSAPPFGVVLESQIDPGLGIVATVLVQQGTFRRAMYILSGESVGRIRIMHDDLGREVDEAVPSTPVRIVGFASLPENGERVYAFEDKRKAEQIAEARKAQRELEVMRSSALKISLDDVFKRIKEGQLRELPVVVKADVQGSAEAIRDALERISVEGTKVQVIRSGVGQITESDVMLASASNAIIIGFSVGATAQAKRLAEQEKVQIKYYDIIYKLTEEIELALKGLLEPEIVEIPLGIVEVRAVFRQEKSSAVVGGMVVSGKVHRGALYRLKRNGNVLFEGELASLRRFKDDVKEVAEGFECGLLLEGTNDVQEGDILEFFTKETRSPFEATTPPSESS